MTIAQGSRSQVAFVPEVTFGVTPGTPQLVALPYTSFGVNLTKDIFEDDTILSDRQVRYSIHGNQTVSGEIAANFSHGNFDALLESLCHSTWTSNVLKTGTTRKSFAIEQGSLDIGQYSLYNGVVVDKLTLDIPTSGIVTAKFGVMGTKLTLAQTSIDAVVTAPTDRQPYTHNGGTFKEGGVSVGFITALSLSVDNGYAANFSLGNTFARDLTYGMSKISGTATVFFEDIAMYNKFVNGTQSSLEFTLTDGTNTFNVELPRVKFNGATKTISGNQSISLSIPFVGLYDPTDASNIVLTRSA